MFRRGTHTNYEIAQVVQGLLSASQISSLLFRHFDVKLFEGAELALKCISPVLIGSRLSSHATVAKVELANDWLLELATQDQSQAVRPVGSAKEPK